MSLPFLPFPIKVLIIGAFVIGLIWAAHTSGLGFGGALLGLLAMTLTVLVGTE